MFLGIQGYRIHEKPPTLPPGILSLKCPGRSGQRNRGAKIARGVDVQLILVPGDLIDTMRQSLTTLRVRQVYCSLPNHHFNCPYLALKHKSGQNSRYSMPTLDL